VINLAISEFGLAIINPFSSVYFDRSEGVQRTRQHLLSCHRSVFNIILLQNDFRPHDEVG